MKLSSHNLAVNSAKCYNLQEDIKICKICEKKRTEMKFIWFLVAINMITFEEKHLAT